MIKNTHEIVVSDISETHATDGLPVRKASTPPKGFIEKLKAMVRFALDPKAPLGARLMVFGALAYAAIPIDVIPDPILIFGWLDDVGAMLIAYAAASKHFNSVAG